MEIILSGDRIDAEQALRIGLVNRVFDPERLMEESLKYAAHLASRAPLAQQFAKDVMRRAHGLTIDEALKLESMSFHNLGATADLDEGTTAFKEKRKAKFIGK